MRRLRRYLALPLVAALGAIGACSSDPPADPDLASQLERDTGMKWNVFVDPRDHEVRFLAPEAPVQIGSGTPEENAREFFTRYGAALHASGKSDELNLVSDVTDPRGGRHIRFEHTLPGTGLPVFHAGTTAHFTADGSVYWMVTDFRADLAGLDPSATVTKEAASSIAIAHIKASCGASRSEPVAARTELGVLSDPETPAALVHRVLVSAQTERCIAPSVFVNARTGVVLSVEERSRSLATTEVGGSRFFRTNDSRDKKSINITFSGPRPSVARYSMISEAAPNERVFTHSFGSDSAIETTDATLWDAASPPRGRGAAVDAHHLVGQGLFFLRSFDSRRAARSAGAPALGHDVHVFVHDNSSNNGAYAHADWDLVNGRDTVSFGDGDPSVPSELPYAAAYDVVAHELTHLVTKHTSALGPFLDPGALDESFSDVMAAAAEHATGQDDARSFTIGESLYIAGQPGPTALRSMTAPRSVPNPDGPTPDHVDDKKRCPKEGPIGGVGGNDNCWVHTNSGIPSRAFSLIVLGGSIYKFAAGRAPELRPIGVPSGLGWTDATELTYWAMTGLRSNTLFEEAAFAQIAEANVRGASALNITTCAWYAVGVFTPRTPVESALLDAFCKPPPPKAAPPPPPSGVTGANLCAGHGDSLVCDPEVPVQAVACKNGAPTIPPRTVFCADLAQTCKKVSASDPTAVMEDGVIVCE